MANEISLIDGTLILNGVEIEGFGDSETALEFPNTDIAAVRRGAAGGMVTGKTGNFGGAVNITLLPNSTGFKFLMGIRISQQTGANIKLNGFYSHTNGHTSSLEGGTLTNAPVGTTVGNGAPPAQTFTIEFQTIISDYVISNVS